MSEMARAFPCGFVLIEGGAAAALVIEVVDPTQAQASAGIGTGRMGVNGGMFLLG